MYHLKARVRDGRARYRKSSKHHSQLVFSDGSWKEAGRMRAADGRKTEKEKKEFTGKEEEGQRKEVVHTDRVSFPYLVPSCLSVHIWRSFVVHGGSAAMTLVPMPQNSAILAADRDTEKRKKETEFTHGGRRTMRVE